MSVAPFTLSDEAAMDLALAQARRAQDAGEVPVGAVVVHQGRVVGVGHNSPIHDRDPSAHAEIIALRQAAQALGNYRLEDCTLYVTLEPCAMCCGAIAHARLSRLVFGAFEPKTGAVQSITRLFDLPGMHAPDIVGGVQAQACGQLLQSFFRDKRLNTPTHALLVPLRDDAVRTPESCFSDLPDFPWSPTYVSDLPALNGLRMHCLDLGPKNAACTWLCLHGNPAWGYLYRKMMPVFLAAGHRVVVPDMPGFGRSDKPKKAGQHQFAWHRQVLLDLIHHLDLQHMVLVVQDWGGILGLTLPMAEPWRYQGLLAMNTTLATGRQTLSPGFLAWRQMCNDKPLFDVGRLMARGNPHLSASECAAYQAPFPDAGHRAALRAFPNLVPARPDDAGAELSRQAEVFWREHWSGRSLLVVGEQDPVLGVPVMQSLQQCIRHAPPLWHLPQAGHFVQEHGQAIAQRAVVHFSTQEP
ncbi:MAG: tRNA adenosine(34) deaminase TadA [Betaproteobacteria bacterium]|nr:tRNA adenosine(34) deaminase TadA [Betaproteobacteria bacterium]NBY04120.1 tRNA adenosine(34) deaminase TadA [Betaproteobacteria bacterium]